jgi:uncharacterized membrane-anchored protein YhcB (DUF1043 family)
MTNEPSQVTKLTQELENAKEALQTERQDEVKWLKEFTELLEPIAAEAWLFYAVKNRIEEIEAK